MIKVRWERYLENKLPIAQYGLRRGVGATEAVAPLLEINNAPLLKMII